MESNKYVHVFIYTDLYIHVHRDTTFKVEKMSTTVLRSYQVPQPCFLSNMSFISASSVHQTSSIFSSLDVISMIL